MSYTSQKVFLTHRKMPVPLVLTTLDKEIGKLLDEKPLIWVNSQPTEEDLDHLLKEGNSRSEFDPRGLRKQMVDELAAKRAVLITRTCPLAKIMAVVYPDQIPRIPWKLFASIFQAFGKKGCRLVWFANPTPRLLPESGESPAAYHMNGGYASRCTPNSIVIYREEEVARVLVHELLHAACTDNIRDPVEIIEAKTETWAELFLLAIIAGGRPRVLQNLWNIQSQWIVDQEDLLKRNHLVLTPADYAWRYTLGRRGVLEGLGCVLPNPRNTCTSLRFTSPSLGDLFTK